MKKEKRQKLRYFGEEVEGYSVRVFNEREARGAAGILFLFAMIAFMNAFLIGNFTILKIFVTSFFIDFFIRMFINPKYAPTLIVARYFTRKQDVEYTGAPQKRFAWGIGLILSAVMFILVVVYNVRGLLNLGICLLCLTLLFFESIFGICLGCKMYNLFNKEKAKLCPGGACKIRRKEKIQDINSTQIFIVILFICTIILLTKIIL